MSYSNLTNVFSVIENLWRWEKHCWWNTQKFCCRCCNAVNWTDVIFGKWMPCSCAGWNCIQLMGVCWLPNVMHNGRNLWLSISIQNRCSMGFFTTYRFLPQISKRTLCKHSAQTLKSSHFLHSVYLWLEIKLYARIAETRIQWRYTAMASIKRILARWSPDIRPKIRKKWIE